MSLAKKTKTLKAPKVTGRWTTRSIINPHKTPATAFATPAKMLRWIRFHQGHSQTERDRWAALIWRCPFAFLRLIFCTPQIEKIRKYKFKYTVLLCVKLNNGFHMLTATCHCKNVRLDIKMKTLKKIEKCNCSMCSRKFAAYFFVDVDKLSLANGQDSLAEYSFHSKQAKHFFCRRLIDFSVCFKDL